MRYFAEPHIWSTYVEKGPACHFCHREGPGYEGPYYGTGPDIELVCEECLAAGLLETVDATTCSGDTDALHAQLAAQSLMAAQRKAQLAERTRALEGRTPPLITWQDLLWPAHCSDYCRFVKEVGRKDVEKLAGDDDPQSWLEEHLEESTQESTDIDDLWESITPKSLEQPSKWGLCVYLFECLTCAEPVLLWDSE
jgi:uncharacterized protein CbrC (UPF0167 family)